MSNEGLGGFQSIPADDPEANGSVQEHTLCYQCKNLIRKSRNINQGATFMEYEQFSHYPSFQDLEKSAENGCHLCSLIWWNWEDVAKKPVEGASETARKVTVEIEKSRAPVMIDRINVNPFGLLGERHSDTPDFEYRYLRIERYQGRSSKMRDFRYHQADWVDSSKRWHAAQVAKSTASDDTFMLGKYWLQRCLTHHRECCKAQLFPNDQRPTRLLAVGQGDTIRLVLTSELRKKPKYLTLSHCWGGADIVKLKLNNLGSFQNRISLAVLPKTFQDAIIITRRLGYEYLWIDSLCIIQDSPEDWSKESKIMGFIYRQSVCTIAALAAQNSHHGCFTRRNPLYYRHCRILGTSEKGVYVMGSATPKMWVTGGYGEPCKLNRRGWVVQERLLSPRTLYFGPRSIGWECVQCEATENEPEETESSFAHHPSTLRPKQTFALLGQSLSKDTPVDSDEFVVFRNAWWDIVSTYTGCNLTYSSDKLVAMAGMISVIEARTGLTNIAGHWREFLLQDILWKAWMHAKRGGDARAPSWSWASMDFQVYGTYFDEIFHTVCNSETKLMYELDWVAKVEDVGTSLVISEFLRGGQVLTDFLILRGKARMIAAAKYQGLQQLFDDDRDGDHGQPILYVLIVRGAKRFNQDGRVYKGTRSFQDEGLMLVPQDGAQSQWRRIGAFFQNFEEGEAKRIFLKKTPERVLTIV